MWHVPHFVRLSSLRASIYGGWLRGLLVFDKDNSTPFVVEKTAPADRFQLDWSKVFASLVKGVCIGKTFTKKGG